MLVFPEPVLRSLKSERFGWMRPDGTVLACALHRHLEILRNDPQGAAFLRPLDEARIELDSIRATCAETGLEWHAYDVAEADLPNIRAAVLRALYQAGWIRIGLLDAQPRGLEAESAAWALAQHEDNLALLADDLDALLTTRPVRTKER